ncbi:MAG: L-arabinose ABC transporter permease AraH [Propionivibrio sp.]
MKPGTKSAGLAIDLQGKRAFVSGVSSGIGAAIAATLAQAGCDVAGCGRSAEGSAGVAAFHAVVRGFGRQSTYVQADFTDPAAPARAIAAARAALGGIDVLVSNAGLLCATIISQTGSITLGIGARLLAGSSIGAINGLIIAKLRINALITTLAMMEIVRGLGFIVSGGQAIGISNEAFFALGNTQLFGIPVPVIITVLCFIIFGIALNKTTYGRNILAIGGNPDAARLAGVNVIRLRILVFLFQGLVCALAGVILASRITSGQPNAAMGFELNVISACVLGGVSLAGGRATISGVIVGVLIMGTVENAMNLLNIDAFYQYLVRGMILLTAVTIDQLKNRRSGL